MKEYKDHSLLQHNTFGIDVRCRRLVEYATASEAQALCHALTAADSPLLIIGAGSNLLLTADYPGTVITPENRFEIRLRTGMSDARHVYIDCWAGTTFDDVVAYAVGHGWYGAENLSLIPGQVGASAVQNIGAYGAEVKDIIHEVRAVEIATGDEVASVAKNVRTGIAKAVSSATGATATSSHGSPIGWAPPLRRGSIMAISVPAWRSRVSWHPRRNSCET